MLQNTAESEANQSLKLNNLKINRSILTMCYVSFINTDEVNPRNFYGDNHLQPMQLIEHEMSLVLQGAALVVLVQMTVILLLTQIITGDNFKVLPANEFSVVVLRLISSLMIHITIEPKIRNGINLMKYAVNHPQNFRLTIFEKEYNNMCLATGMFYWRERLIKVSRTRVLWAFSVAFV